MINSKHTEPLKTSPSPEHLAEYQAATAYFAQHDRLPACMGSPGAIDFINGDPEAFFLDVRLNVYATAGRRSS